MIRNIPAPISGAGAILAILWSQSAGAACTSYAACSTSQMATDDDLLNSMYLRGSIGYGIGSRPNVSIEGWSIDGLSRNGSLSTSFAIGGYVTPDWRVELSASPILNSKIEYNSPLAIVGGTAYSAGVRNSSTILPIMFDVYHDFNTKTAFRPYVGAGIGVAYAWSDLTANLSGGTTNIDYKVASSTSASFAASGMLGVGYDLSKNLTLDLGYKYLYVDQIQTKANILGYTVTASAKQNSFSQFLVGARYRFN